MLVVLLAGCAEAPGDDGHDPLEDQSDSLAAKAHVLLRIAAGPTTLEAGENGTWDLEAEHTGPPGAPVFRYWMDCAQPWRVAVHDGAGEGAGEPVPLEPVVICHAVGYDELPPGAITSFNWTWDGTAYQEDGPDEPLAAGLYKITFSFVRFMAPADEEPLSLTTDVEID